MEIIHNRIAQLRRRVGISQTALGEKIGVTQRSVSLYEHGENMPSRAALFAMASFFQVTIGYLLGNESEPPPPNPALTSLMRRMMEQHDLRTAAQTLIFTDDALTARELDTLLQGGLPVAIEEAHLVNFFRKFDFDLVRQYFKIARLPLPGEFENLDADLREIMERVATSTDNSAEALEYVVALTKDIFARKGGERTP